jgi:hypothetical protein
MPYAICHPATACLYLISSSPLLLSSPPLLSSSTQSFNKSPPDSYYPVAHTCFFSLELPRYSSLQILKDKLRYAIFNCEAIDGDDGSSGMAIAAMGWEE